MKFIFLLLRLVLKVCYRVEVRGLDNYEKAGKRVIIMPNHVSFLDPPLLTAFLPEKPSFAINTMIAQLPIVKAVLWMFNVYKLDPTNPLSAKSLIEFVQKDNKVVIFPEGRITVTGSLMKVYEGPGMIAEKSDAMILPVYIENAQYTPFSRLKGKVRRRWFPKIYITILPPFKLEKKIAGRGGRAYTAELLERAMSETMFAASRTNRSVTSVVLEAAGTHGFKHIVAEDIARKPLSYRKLFLKTIALSTALKKKLQSEYIGVLMPNSLGGIVTFLSLHRLQKVPAMLNFTAGAININNACKAAQIKQILTSKLFIKKAGLDELISGIQDVEIIYLEDIAKGIKFLDKLDALLLSYLPAIAFSKATKTNCNKPAALLFTSGSEGAPKGVALSHKNLVSNVRQAESIIDLVPEDVLLNALPMFHSFGLTVGTLLPLITGMRVFMYPSPIHYNIIPEVAYAIKATLMCGTDTFLNKYGQAAHPYDFFNVRYVIAGAEKLKDSTRKLWSDKFGIRIFEGYGVTETSPLLSVNTPMFNKPGTVGRIVPGVEWKIKPVEGIADGGELWIKGANVMLGYIKIDRPGEIQALEDGWYNTGDIVKADETGFITIQGRAKRFAKIAGEMVSLPLIEEVAGKLWHGEPLAVVAVKDDRKGEQLVMVVPNKNLKLGEFKEFAKTSGLPEIAVPRKIIYAEIPLLGSGKTDFPKLQKVAEEQNALEKDSSVKSEE